MISSEKPCVRVGTSGWNYRHWKEVFYPKGLSSRKWLEFYATHFNTVEVNATFYRTLPEKTFAGWYDRTPEGFLWSVKAPRKITHHLRLENAASLCKEFLNSLSPLREKLGPILFQLPPGLKYTPEKHRTFLELISRIPLAVIEPRNNTWFEDAVLEELKSHRIALCISHSGGRFPYLETITSNFAYLRLHGPKRLYASEYSLKDLEAWAGKIRAWNVPSFVYFNNDFNGYAVKNALQLLEILQQI
ncbi:DUF72 domain-containing protein [Thermodesulforhabdus norvegica]|uniref:Uncharacterized conserved protein YecE, DUF72 family n=1 Tax=Thermodesulforhabdus norvegica TaxID=39841 RepID=A0A1I4T785_9BACT|nr:DUF72 domain-containing protein [Thermodesulforhabdus norvegica]SFM72491.1 Uncharacterized conserved protein YecE, DUF72 family [Thermodesulforhabdus norvegica]